MYTENTPVFTEFTCRALRTDIYLGYILVIIH